jgi:hypothetical protein
LVKGSDVLPLNRDSTVGDNCESLKQRFEAIAELKEL